VFGGNTYTAFPIEIDTSTWTSKGDIPTLGIRVSNIANTFNQIVREYNAGVGGTVKLTIVSSEYLSENYAELEREFTILSASVDNYWVSWQLGSANPLRQRFPLYTYMAHYCNWVQNFKGAECKYSGPNTTCNGTWQQCQDYSNTSNFGGFPGLYNPEIRIV
jgi:phage-related protein